MKAKLVGLVAIAIELVISPAYSSTICANETCGFVYSGGTYTPLSVPGSTLTEAFGISSNQIVGQYWTGDNAFTEQGFLYNGGAYTTISGPGGTAIQPYDINNRGQIVGTGGGFNGGFLYSNGAYTPINVPGGTGSIPSG